MAGLSVMWDFQIKKSMRSHLGNGISSVMKHMMMTHNSHDLFCMDRALILRTRPSVSLYHTAYIQQLFQMLRLDCVLPKLTPQKRPYLPPHRRFCKCRWYEMVNLAHVPCSGSIMLIVDNAQCVVCLGTDKLQWQLNASFFEEVRPKP